MSLDKLNNFLYCRIPVEPNTTDFFLKRYSHLVNKHWPDMYGAPCKGDKGAPIWKNFELPTDDTGAGW